MLIALPQRAILEISGPDRLDFLQGLVSNDVRNATEHEAVYAALLTPQGKYLFDFFILAQGDTLLLEAEAARAPALLQRLGMYRLRSQVTLRMRPELQVFAVLGSAIPPGGFTDPRYAPAGGRLWAEAAPEGMELGEAEQYEQHRLELCLPDGSRDLPPEGTILLENGFEALHGIDFHKGCYVGQEVTARSKHRGQVRKHLYGVRRVDGPLPAYGDALMQGEAVAGEMRSGTGDRGLAMLRLEAVARGLPLQAANGAVLEMVRPAWLA